MTEEERQELEQCSHRIAELLYQEAIEQKRPVANLAGIERKDARRSGGADG
jgi:hypothetical protein